MTASSTSTNSADRGGLSRRQRAAIKGARRRSDDDLITSIFGDVQPHFQENPLDGQMLGAIPQPQPVSDAAGPAPAAMTADDPVADRATWFEGSGREGVTSAPESQRPAALKAPSLASAVVAATNGLVIDAAMTGDGEDPLVTGLPGDEYDYMDLLDKVSPTPPSTY